MNFNINGSNDKKMKEILWKWVLPFAVMMLIAVFGMFIDRQELNANKRPATLPSKTAEALPAAPAAQQVAIQEIEKTARASDKQASRPSIWPTTGEITSNFGWRNAPMGNGGEYHPGIDIANSMDTPIVATADGIVTTCGWAGGYGNLVAINHGNGIVTMYGHNSRIIVTTGESVHKGQIISYMGSTGWSTGPHSHYEVRENGQPVNPTSYLVQY